MLHSKIKFSKRFFGDLGAKREDLRALIKTRPDKFRPRTYDEWNRLSFHIRKGERSTHRAKNGKPLFTAHQIKDVRIYDSPMYSIDEILGTDYYGVLS